MYFVSLSLFLSLSLSMGQTSSSATTPSSAEKRKPIREARAAGAAQDSTEESSETPVATSKPKKKFTLSRSRNSSLTSAASPLSLRASGSDKFNRKKLEALFDRFASMAADDGDEDHQLSDDDEGHSEASIGPKGFQALVEELGYGEEDVLSFIVSWKLQARRLGVISRQEFLEGLSAMRVDSMAKLKEKLVPELLAQYTSKRKEVFMYAYQLARLPGARTLDLESAGILLPLFLPPKEFVHTAPFAAFLRDQQTYRAINKDQWSQTYDFLTTMDATCSTYSDDGAWPCMIDAYVEYVAQADRKAEGT